MTSPFSRSHPVQARLATRGARSEHVGLRPVEVTMQPICANLFSDLPAESDDEVVTNLFSAPRVRIERIVSTGQASPADFWYDQAWSEWVLVVSGSAKVLFADTMTSHLMGPGDYLQIPPHRRHRVEWTEPNTATVWLAVHFDDGPAA
jgi:cupin 2 domain-containing protein